MAINTFTIEEFDIVKHNINLCGEINESCLTDINSKLCDIVVEDKEIIRKNKDKLSSSPLFTFGCNFDFNLPEINIFMSSLGGICYCGMSMYDIIRTIGETYNTNIICSGYVMSMGVILLQSANNRIATKNTTFMIHDISTFMYGKLEAIEESVEESKRIRGMIENVLLSRTKLTKELLTSIYKEKRDFYFDAEKALEYGVIDKIL